MAKIPLADDPSSKDSSQEKKSFFNKWMVISMIISTLVLIGIGALVFLMEYYGYSDPLKGKNAYLRIFSDCFSVAGLIGILVYFLTYVSSKGAFDLLAYSVKLLVLNIFNQKYRKESFPKTYYDYKVIKDHQNRKPLLAILIPSAIFLVVGIILLILYSNI